MIAKFTTGNGFSGCIRYVTRKGQKIKPGQVRVASAHGLRYDADGNGGYFIDLKKAAFDFRQQTLCYAGTLTKPVYHWSLSYSPKDIVTDRQMVEDAKDFLNRVGFGNTQQLMVVHRDKAHPHIHIITNVINDEGKHINVSWLGPRAKKASADITKEKGYTWGKKREGNVEDTAHKPHERAKHAIEPVIREAMDKATSMDEFENLLKEKGVSCRITPAADGRRAGISYAIEFEGQLHAFRGASVRNDLSYGYIAKAIKANKTKVDDAVKNSLAQAVSAVAGKATSKEEFVAMLKESGITCAIKLAKDGLRGGITFTQTIGGVAHSYKGSELSRELSFAKIMVAFVRNKHKAKADNKACYESYNRLYRPLFNDVSRTCSRAWNTYAECKQQYASVSEELSKGYAALEYTRQQLYNGTKNINDRTTTRKLIETTACAIGLCCPLLGLAFGLLGLLADACSYTDEEARLREQMKATRQEIDELRERQQQLQQDKSDALKAYLKANERREDLDSLMRDIEKPVYLTQRMRDDMLHKAMDAIWKSTSTDDLDAHFRASGTAIIPEYGPDGHLRDFRMLFSDGREDRMSKNWGVSGMKRIFARWEGAEQAELDALAAHSPRPQAERETPISDAAQHPAEERKETSEQRQASATVVRRKHPGGMRR